MLIHQPNPIENESWPGYLLRLAQVNYLNGIGELASVLSVDSRELVVSNPKKFLSKFNSLAASDKQFLEVNSVDRGFKTEKNSRLHGFKKSMRTRVCALCLKNQDKLMV